MFNKRPRQSSLIEEIMRDCEYLLVEAAIGFARDREWKVRGYLGKEYRVALVVDEWTDSPLIEIRDAESGEIERHLEINVMCWPKRR